MKKETFEGNRPFAGPKKATMKRRQVGHDYTRRGIYMVTMAVEGRRPLFGRVYGSADEPRIELTALGSAVRDEWWNIPHYHPEVKVMDLQMMPDHLHGILFITAPLSGGLSGVVRGFKTGCGRAYRRLVAPSGGASGYVATQSQQAMTGGRADHGPSAGASGYVATESQQAMKGGEGGRGGHPAHGLLFEPGFNDLVLRSEEEYLHWRRYLRDNPRRLLMKRARPEWLRPFFQFACGGHCYSGIGNRELLKAPLRLNVRISRRLSEQQLQAEVARYLAAAEQGAVLISPAISPGEKQVMRQAFDRRLPTVVIVENGFTPLSKPRGEQFDACSEGRLLMLSPWEHHNEQRPLTAYQCQQMNLMALELSQLAVEGCL